MAWTDYLHNQTVYAYDVNRWAQKSNMLLRGQTWTPPDGVRLDHRDCSSLHHPNSVTIALHHHVRPTNLHLLSRNKSLSSLGICTFRSCNPILRLQRRCIYHSHPMQSQIRPHPDLLVLLVPPHPRILLDALRDMSLSISWLGYDDSSREREAFTIDA